MIKKIYKKWKRANRRKEVMNIVRETVITAIIAALFSRIEVAATRAISKLFEKKESPAMDDVVDDIKLAAKPWGDDLD